MTTIYADESGFTGSDLLSGEQTFLIATCSQAMLRSARG